MPIYKCEKCGKVHRTEDDVCCQSDQLAESKPGGVSANGDGSLSCAPQATTGNEVNRHFPPVWQTAEDALDNFHKVERRASCSA